MRTFRIEITFSDGSKGFEDFDSLRIKRAFNFGRGTVKDFKDYVKNNNYKLLN